MTNTLFRRRSVQVICSVLAALSLSIGASVPVAIAATSQGGSTATCSMYLQLDVRKGPLKGGGIAGLLRFRVAPSGALTGAVEQTVKTSPKRQIPVTGRVADGKIRLVFGSGKHQIVGVGPLTDNVRKCNGKITGHRELTGTFTGPAGNSGDWAGGDYSTITFADRYYGFLIGVTVALSCIPPLPTCPFALVGAAVVIKDGAK